MGLVLSSSSSLVFFGGVNKSKIGFKRFGGKWNGLSGVKNPKFRCCGCAPSRRFYLFLCSNFVYFLIMSARASHVFIVFADYIFFNNFLTYGRGGQAPIEPMLRHDMDGVAPFNRSTD